MVSPTCSTNHVLFRRVQHCASWCPGYNVGTTSRIRARRIIIVRRLIPIYRIDLGFLLDVFTATAISTICQKTVREKPSGPHSMASNYSSHLFTNLVFYCYWYVTFTFSVYTLYKSSSQNQWNSHRVKFRCLSSREHSTARLVERKVLDSSQPSLSFPGILPYYNRISTASS